jgi:hypothetical protein
MLDPYIQHNSLASAGPVYPYNTSVYSEQPDYRDQRVHINTLSHDQGRVGGYENGIYAYAGGMPDSLPRNSLTRSAQIQMSPAGMGPGGYMVPPNLHSGYPSTIYPDPPDIRNSARHARVAHDCEECLQERHRADRDHYAEKHSCHCDHKEQPRRASRRPRKDHRPEVAVPFSDSSSEDDQHGDAYLRVCRPRGHRIPEETQELLPQRLRHRSGGSRRKRTASRAPGLASVTQLSISSGDYSDTGPNLALGDIREKTDVGNMYRVERHSNGRLQRRLLGDESDQYRSRPEDLRLDTLRLHDDVRLGNEDRAGRKRHLSIPRNGMHTGQPRNSDSPVSGRLSPHVTSREARIRSQSRDGNGAIHGRTSHSMTPPDQRNFRQPHSMPDHVGSPIQEDITEVFPLESRRHSPSRLHRFEYDGNQPAGVMTRSKLHPAFPR